MTKRIKRSRRKKALPVKRKRLSFTIVVDAQPIVVQYKPRCMGEMDQFEFRSPHEPPRRIPVSETGYLCHFADMAEVKAAASPQDFARDMALTLLRSRCKPRPDDRNQLSLF